MSQKMKEKERIKTKKTENEINNMKPKWKILKRKKRNNFNKSFTIF